MNDILKIMIDSLNREEKRNKILFINFSKQKIESFGIKNYFALAICADIKEYNQIKYNIKSTKINQIFDDFIIFNDEGKQKLKRILKNMKNIVGNPPYSFKVEEGRKKSD